MIRDPSDGSVKEIFRVDEPPTKNAAATENESNSKVLMASTTSGLPITNHKAEYLERLEKSRDWIRDYFNRASEQSDSGLRSPNHREG